MASDKTDRVSCEFLKLFARFEWAMKTSGYVKRSRWTHAEPDWERYARSLNGALVADTALEEARRLLLEDPPKTQILNDDGSLGWTVLLREGDTEEKRLLRHVRAVRNNLFHGGKVEAAAGIIGNESRDIPLIEAATAVLMSCLTASPRLAARFAADT